jgi:hypothetical protein
VGRLIVLTGIVAWYLAVVTLVMGLAGCPPPEQKMNTQLKVTPSKDIVRQGEEFTVAIEVIPGDAVNVAGLQLNILFSDEALRVDSIQGGNFLTQNGDPIYFVPGVIGPSSVVKIVGVIVEPGKSVSSPGTFAILNCTALNAGRTSNFQLQGVIVGDVEANSLPLESPVIGQVTVAAICDINLDGFVNVADLALVYQAFGNTGGPEDVKSDGIVNVLDMILVAQHFDVG